MDNNSTSSDKFSNKGIALLEQWKTFNERMTKQLQGVDTVLGVGGGLVIGSLSFAASVESVLVYFFVPFLVYVFVGYWLVKINELYVTGGYVLELENKLNEVLGEKWFLWENTLTRVHFHTSVTSRCFWCIFLFACVVVIVFCEYVVLVSLGVWFLVKCLSLVVNLICCYLLICSFLEVNSAFGLSQSAIIRKRVISCRRSL